MTEAPKIDLVLLVNQVSAQAFQLACQAFETGHESDDLIAQARRINDHLDDLWQVIQQAPQSDQPELSRAWSDARLDVGYVLSKGELSTSTRLFYFIQNQK